MKQIQSHMSLRGHQTAFAITFSVYSDSTPKECEEIAQAIAASIPNAMYLYTSTLASED